VIPDPVAIPRAVARCLRDLAAECAGRPLRVVLYPAGGLTRALLREGLPEPIQVLGVADAAEPAQAMPAGVPWLSPEALRERAPDAVLVASTRFHLEVMREQGADWYRQGFRVVDLCAGLTPLSEFEDAAWRLGLALDADEPGRLRITRPGRPARQILYRREDWGNTHWMLRDFDAICAGFAPDRSGPETLALDFSRPGYHTLLPSGARLFYPSMAEPEALIRQYLDFAGLEPGQTVLDLGAYAGDSTWFFAQAVGPAGRVLAVEPDPASLAALRRNVAEHGLAQVAVDGSAVLDHDGTVSFQAEGSIGSGITETSGRSGGETTVPAVSLATLLARHRFERPDFIKMDIEGAEVRVLAGSAGLLAQLRPRLLIESHPCRGVSNLPEVLRLLDGLGCRREVRDDLVRAWWD
jgi:FkbM family methyltransferase